MATGTIRSYGVKEQAPSGDEISQAVESLRLVGYAVIDSGYSPASRSEIADAFSRAYKIQLELHGGGEALAQIDEHNTIRAPLAYEDAFVDLACNANILKLAKMLFGGSHMTGTYVVNQQNGVINPRKGNAYGQSAFHRDLPYQHFVTSRPIALSALYCVDPFTASNGATLVVPGSHKEEKFPSAETANKIATPIEAPAGSFLVLDSMIYHAGGTNNTERDRRAVNTVYSLPLIRQQIELAGVVGEGRSLSEDAVHLLGLNYPSVGNIDEYYHNKRAKIARANNKN